jgi:hypothetical protein
MMDKFTPTAKRALVAVVAAEILVACSSGAGSSAAPANSRNESYVAQRRAPDYDPCEDQQ